MDDAPETVEVVLEAAAVKLEVSTVRFDDDGYCPLCLQVLSLLLTLTCRCSIAHAFPLVEEKQGSSPWRRLQTGGWQDCCGAANC